MPALNGALVAAAYVQSFAYDNLNRPTNGPVGAHAYCDGAHMHAVTGTTGAPRPGTTRPAT